MEGECKTEQKGAFALLGQDKCGYGSGIPQSQCCCESEHDYFGMMMGLAKCARWNWLRKK